MEKLLSVLNEQFDKIIEAVGSNRTLKPDVKRKLNANLDELTQESVF
jgi:hypothetical protein